MVWLHGWLMEIGLGLMWRRLIDRSVDEVILDRLLEDARSTVLHVSRLWLWMGLQVNWMYESGWTGMRLDGGIL